MKTIVFDAFGPPDVLRLEEREPPRPAANELLVEVHATSVTTAEWRMRAADYGRGMGWLGRLLFGVFGPRNRTTGREFAGRVVAVGSEVHRFSVGDDVFGVQSGANAELLAVPEASAVVRMPAELSYAEAVALPFGGICALDFLEDKAKVRPGEHVLVVGASGGVGVSMVQVAKALGAKVTAVCSAPNFALVRGLGADEVVDYRATDIATLAGPFDVIVDTVGTTSFSSYRRMLSPTGRHVFIEGGLYEMLQGLRPRFGGPRVISGVSIDSPAAFERLVERVNEGVLKPVIGDRFAMGEVIDAHRLVESRHRRGAVVLDFPVPQRDAAALDTA